MFWGQQVQPQQAQRESDRARRTKSLRYSVVLLMLRGKKKKTVLKYEKIVGDSKVVERFKVSTPSQVARKVVRGGK